MLETEKAEINKWLCSKWPEVFAHGLIDKISARVIKTGSDLSILQKRTEELEVLVDRLNTSIRSILYDRMQDALKARELSEKKWWRFW